MAPVTQVLLEDLCKRRFFFTPSFSIYGGVAGLYDLGPPGCALKANMESIWRQHFIIFDNMFEISCTCLTPETVLKVSGHVDRFTDLMVRNEKNAEEFFRADKLIVEEIRARIAEPKLNTTKIPIEQLSKWELDVDTYSPEEMDDVLAKLGTKAKHNLCFPFPFNLMFKTSIGPAGNSVGFLRPETAQGMFVNFRRLLEQNGGKMPFAAAQIGLGFRNEIAPRQQLLRVREFPMAEIEHFVHPKKKNGHLKFKSAKIADLVLPLWSKQQQEAGELGVGQTLTLGAAVEQGIIDNETLAYFMGRVYQYLVKVGLDKEKIRFRQHRSTEMAHYASDCWDAEAETSYGWIEIVGIADRAAYDLTVHSKASKVDLVAHDKLEIPIETNSVEVVIEKSVFGKVFKKDAQKITAMLESLNEDILLNLESDLSTTGKATTPDGTTLARDQVSFKRVSKTIHEEVYTPSVIEPAFGMGRVLYCILEHSFRCRDDLASIAPNGTVNGGNLARCYLALPSSVAPIKVSLLPISAGSDVLDALVSELGNLLGEAGVSYKVDDSGQAIGRRYARTDEIGIPFGVTVDFESPTDKQVTLRERDSMEQVRLGTEKLVHVLQDLVSGRTTWEVVRQIYPLF